MIKVAGKILSVKLGDGIKQFLIKPSNHSEDSMRDLEKKTRSSIALLNSSTPGENDYFKEMQFTILSAKLQRRKL